MKFNEIARTYIGTVQGSTGHKAIIDYYNNNARPLPRGYRVKYTDAWCATFASMLMIQGKGINAPLECSVIQMYRKAKAHNEVTTTPTVGDFIIYDWNDNGTLDHVGVIDEITATTYKVIEGNYNNAVKVRTVKKTSKEIECFIHVPQAGINVPVVNNNIDRVARDVIRGKYGNGSQRKINIERAGYNYAEVQRAVNRILKG